MSRFVEQEEQVLAKQKRKKLPRWLIILEKPNGDKRFAHAFGNYTDVVKRRNTLLHSDDYVSCWLIQKSSTILSS